MPTDRYTALNEMLTLFLGRWATDAPAALGLVDVPHVEYPGVDSGFLPTGEDWWARISFQSVLSEQGTFSENVVTSGSRRYTNSGLVYVQLFAPKRNDSFVLINKLSNAVQNIFRERTLNVNFYNSCVKELASESGCLRYNVVAEFEFDEIS